MTGAEALTYFNIAAKLVRDGKIDEAIAMRNQLLPSDWQIIERRIDAANAKSGDCK